VFIETFVNWHGDLEQLKQHITDAKHSGLRSGICLAVGSVEGIAPTAQAEWQSLLTDWYSSQPDSGTHSAAGWALRKWNGTEPLVDDARAHGKEGGWIVTDQTGLTMIRIPAGQFQRPFDYLDAESKKQTVQITQDFLLSDREVTIELFRQFIDDEEYEGEKPKWEGERKFPGSTPAHPVQQVSWYDAVMFCNWLSGKENRTPYYNISTGRASGETVRSRLEYEVEPIKGADGFRLPTEAEWEYACRAGTTTRFSCGDDEATLARYGIYAANSNSQTAQVGTRLCNAWGLFDMHGNIYEWCWDWYGQYASNAEVRDPLGPTQGSARVARGGSWYFPARLCVSSRRSGNDPTIRSDYLGFRVAAVPSSK
jgi:formylglycine-generating enzyme required for sulfatase activity